MREPTKAEIDDLLWDLDREAREFGPHEWGLPIGFVAPGSRLRERLKEWAAGLSAGPEPKEAPEPEGTIRIEGSIESIGFSKEVARKPCEGGLVFFDEVRDVLHLSFATRNAKITVPLPIPPDWEATLILRPKKEPS